MEIGTHPDDLFIQCSEITDHPGKWFLGISRGLGHNYKLLVTSDDPRSWGDSREEQLAVIKAMLVGESLRVLYESKAPVDFDEFVAEARNWGYTKEWVSYDEELLDRVYKQLVEKGEPWFGSMIDPDRSLNAHMIGEIMERFKDDAVAFIDTSVDPLETFSGTPTSPAHRLA